MGCGWNVRGDMLLMAIFCQAIMDVLVDFCEGQSHANLWIRIKGATNFLGYFPERSPELRRKDGWDLPKYGFRSHICDLTYEQLVAAGRFFEERKERLLETKKKLPMILDLGLSRKERVAAAKYCLGLFSGLNLRYLHYSQNPPNFGRPRV